MSAVPRSAGCDRDWAFEVRPMQRRDLDAVEAGERDIYEFPWSRGNFVDSLVAGYEAWVFHRADSMLGYAVLMWAVDEVHLLNFSVLRQYQGRGMGGAMLRWLLAHLKSRQVRGVLLEVRPSNAIARRLYLRHEFEQVGLRKRYYPAANNTREDALVLVRRFVL